MYNGIGLPTARGSGTNGYIQTNRFFAKAKVSKVITDPSSIKGFDSGQGTAGLTRKPNKDILEHDRKRQIELKLLVLEEKLTDQGYTDSEIAEKLQEARLNLEAQAAQEDGSVGGAVVGSEKKVSDTQTHQIAARKEKQMEKLRAALGIGAETENEKKLRDLPASDSEDIIDDDKPSKSHKKDALVVKKHGKDAVEEKDDARKGIKDKRIEAAREELDGKKRHKKKESRRGRHGESSETDSDGKAVKASKKQHRRSTHSRESDDESDADVRKRKQKSSKKLRKSRRHDSDYSDSESDSKSNSESSSDSGRDRKYGKSRKRHDSDDDYSSDEDSKYKSQKANKILKRGRHDSEDESSSDVEKKDRRNHSEKKRSDHRSAFRSEKDDMVRDDHGVIKGRKDKVGGRYDLESDSESDKALEGKNKIDKTRRRHDSDEDESSSDREKEDRRNHSEKRNERQSAFRSETDEIARDDHRVSRGRRDERYDLKSNSDFNEAPKPKNKVESTRKIDSGSDKALKGKNKIDKTRRRHDSDEDESSSDREKEDRRNHSEKRNERQSAFRSEKDDIARDDHRVSRGRRDERYDLKSNSDFNEAPKPKNTVESTRKSDSGSDKALKGKYKIDKTRSRHDSDEDESSSDREKEDRRNHSEKRNERQSAFRSEKDDACDDHRVSRGRRDERYDLKSNSDFNEAPKPKNKVENPRKRHDSDEDDSDYDKKTKIQKSRRHDSDEDESGDSRDSSSESDASERSDHRRRGSVRNVKSLEKNTSRQLYDLADRERKLQEKGYAREDDENMKHKRATQKVDDGLDMFRKLENLYQSRDEKRDGSKYGGQEPNRSKRKMDDENWDEQPEGKSRRRDLGKEAELGGAKSEAEAKSRRPGQDYDVNDRRRRESEDNKEHQARKHRREEEDDVYRKHGTDRDYPRERPRREQEEDHGSRYGRDRDLDSSKRARYNDSHSSRRYDDDRHDDRRSRR